MQVTTDIIPIDYDVTHPLMYRSTAHCWYRLIPGIGWVVQPEGEDELPPMTAQELTAFFAEKSAEYTRHYVL